MKSEINLSICEKSLLNNNEAAAYTGIGMRTLIKLSQEPGCSFVLYVGTKRMFRREKLEEYLLDSSSI